MTEKYIDPSDVSARIAALEVTNDFSNINNAGGVILTAAFVVDGHIWRQGAAGVSDTLPSAAAILGNMDRPSIGDTFEFLIRNNNTGTLTLVAGTGITLEGTTSIATLFARRYVGVVTAVGAAPAVTIHGMYTAAV